MEEKGVSPIVVIAIVIVIVAVGAGGYLLLKGGEGEDPPPQPPLPPSSLLTVTAEKSAETTVELTILHEGGDDLAIAELDIMAETSHGFGVTMTSVDFLGSGTFSAGDSITATYDYGAPVPAGTVITVFIVHLPTRQKIFSSSTIVVQSVIEFELKSWEVVDDYGWPALKLSCYSAVTIGLYLYDSNLDQIDAGSISFTAMEDGSETYLLQLAGMWETPMSGTYSLVVKSTFPQRKPLYTKDFAFSGADVSVTSCDITDWTYWHSGDYTLQELSVDVSNDGDLPAYVDKILINIDGKDDYIFAFEPCILPGESKTITESI